MARWPSPEYPEADKVQTHMAGYVVTCLQHCSNLKQGQSVPEKTRLFLESTAICRKDPDESKTGDWSRASHFDLTFYSFNTGGRPLHHFCERKNVESSRKQIDPAAPLPAGRLEVGGRLVGPGARSRQNREAVSSGIIAPRLHLPDLKSRRRTRTCNLELSTSNRVEETASCFDRANR